MVDFMARTVLVKGESGTSRGARKYGGAHKIMGWGDLKGQRNQLEGAANGQIRAI